MALNKTHDKPGQNIGYLDADTVSRAAEFEIGLLLKPIIGLREGQVGSEVEQLFRCDLSAFKNAVELRLFIVNEGSLDIAVSQNTLLQASSQIRAVSSPPILSLFLRPYPATPITSARFSFVPETVFRPFLPRSFRIMLVA